MRKIFGERVPDAAAAFSSHSPESSADSEWGHLASKKIRLATETFSHQPDVNQQHQIRIAKPRLVLTGPANKPIMEFGLFRCIFTIGPEFLEREVPHGKSIADTLQN